MQRKKKHSVISFDGEQFMSLTQSHRRRVKQKIQDSHGSVAEVRHAEHDSAQSVQEWVTISLGHTGYTRQLAVSLDCEGFEQAFEVTLAKLRNTISASACSSIVYGSVQNHLINRPLKSFECSSLAQVFDNKRYPVRPFIYQAPQSKSVFDMSAAEFKNYVRPRAVELANDRWDQGLSLSAPAGEGYEANQFFHIYKDKSVQLVEVEQETGAIKFIKQIS